MKKCLNGWLFGVISYDDEQIANFIVCLKRYKGLLVSPVKISHMVFNHTFSVAAPIIAKNQVISILFRSFYKSCHAREIRSPTWKVALILGIKSPLPYESLKLLAGTCPSRPAFSLP